MWDVQCLAHFLWPELLLAKWANCTLHVRLPAWNQFLFFKFGWNLGKGYFSTVVQITSRFDHCCVCWLRRNFCQYIKWRHFPLSTNQGKDDTLFPKCCLGAWEISYGKNLLLLPYMMSWYYHICFIFAFLGDNKRGKNGLERQVMRLSSFKHCRRHNGPRSWELYNKQTLVCFVSFPTLLGRPGNDWT